MTNDGRRGTGEVMDRRSGTEDGGGLNMTNDGRWGKQQTEDEERKTSHASFQRLSEGIQLDKQLVSLVTNRFRFACWEILELFDEI